MCDLNAIGIWLTTLEALLIVLNGMLASIAPNLGTLFGTSAPVLYGALLVVLLAAETVRRIMTMLTSCAAVCPQTGALNTDVGKIGAALGVQFVSIGLAMLFPATLFLTAGSIVTALALESMALSLIPGDISRLSGCPGSGSRSLVVASITASAAFAISTLAGGLIGAFWLGRFGR